MADAVLTELHEASDDIDLCIDLRAELASLEIAEQSLEMQIQIETDIEQTKESNQ